MGTGSWTVSTPREVRVATATIDLLPLHRAWIPDDSELPGAVAANTKSARSDDGEQPVTTLRRHPFLVVTQETVASAVGTSA